MKKLFAFCVAFFLCTMSLLPLTSFGVAAADSNLAKGKTYSVSTEANIDNAFPKQRYTDNGYALTDGRKGNATDISTNWISFYRGLSRTVTVDLGKTVYVNEFRAGFLNIKAYGIMAPRTVKFAVSTDGEFFHTVYANRDDSICSSSNKERVAASYKSDDGYFSARYVRIYFTCDVFVYMDEFEVIGTETKPDVVNSYSPDAEEVFPNEFASKDNPLMDGADNIVLIYNGKYYNGTVNEIGSHSADKMLPLFAYVDKTGKNYSDTLFDSCLFLPLAPGDTDDGSFRTQKGWEAYLENTIGADDGVNLTALETLVGTIKEKLSLPDDYKVNVFMTIPTITRASRAFGSLDGTSRIAPNNLENAKKIVKWFVDLSASEFEKQNFKHLNLTGFYWYSESVAYSSAAYDPDLIRYFTSYCHSLDHAAIWIPFYGAPGFWEGNELGFDVAALQSGYAFPGNGDSEVGSPLKGTCYDSMSIAKKYGMGVEIELQLVSDAPERYSDYLAQSYKLGCMQNGVSMYYQQGGEGDFSRAAASTTAKVRNIYDMTYKYVKGTYAVTTPYMEKNEIDIVVNLQNKRNRGNFPIKDDDSLASSLKIAERTDPQHGTVSLEGGGFFLYMPEDGYVGNDSFTFRVTDGDNVSELFTVNVTVVDGGLLSAGENKELDRSSTVVYIDCEKSFPNIDDAYEIVVDKNGKVISAGNSNGADVPDGGFVIANSGTNSDWARENVTVGQTVKYDPLTSNIAFLSDEGTVDESSQDDSSVFTESGANSKDGESSGFPIIPVVAAAVLVLVAVAVVVIIKTRKKE